MRWRRPKPVPDAGPGRCACGAPLDLVDMDYGFEMPDVVFAMPPEQRRERVAGGRRLCLVDGHGGFVRTMLPVRLDVGSVQFGVWLSISAEAYREARLVWDEPAYTDLRFAGTVANLLPPWEDRLLGALATAAPQSQDALPYVVGGAPIVEALLHDVWPRADVVAALPALGHEH